MKSVLVLSPHMDDAVLSTFDFLDSIRSAYRPIVANIFTSFQTKIITGDTQKYLLESGFSNVQKFEVHRKNEEAAALNAARIQYINLDYVDGGFRDVNSQPVYRNHKQLFSGKIAITDRLSLQKKLIQSFKQLEVLYQPSLVLIPLGIGKHADHLLVKKAAQCCFKSACKLYWKDIPYGISLSSKYHSTLKQIVKKKYALPGPSAKKLEILGAYSSQVNLLGITDKHFSEELVCF